MIYFNKDSETTLKMAIEMTKGNWWGVFLLSWLYKIVVFFIFFSVYIFIGLFSIISMLFGVFFYIFFRILLDCLLRFFVFAPVQFTFPYFFMGFLSKKKNIGLR